MNRTTRYKFGYLLLLIGALTGAYLYWQSFRPGTLSMLVVGLLFLIPGRVQGYFYRDLFSATQLLNSGQPARAIPLFERFLQYIRESPWRKHLLWLAGTIYTPSVEAMTLYNSGLARLLLGEIEEAESLFHQALALDSLYPLPHFQLAVIQQVSGNESEAEKSRLRAKELGYTESTSDRLVQFSQRLLANLEGRLEPGSNESEESGHQP